MFLEQPTKYTLHDFIPHLAFKVLVGKRVELKTGH